MSQQVALAANSDSKLSPMQGSKNNTSGGHEAVGWGVTLPTKNVVTVTSQNIQRFSSTRLNACIVEDMYFQPAYPNDLGGNVAPSLTGRSNLSRMCTDWRYTYNYPDFVQQQYHPNRERNNLCPITIIQVGEQPVDEIAFFLKYQNTGNGNHLYLKSPTDSTEGSNVSINLEEIWGSQVAPMKK